MERIGKFVIRDCGVFIHVYRIVGYDFEKKHCIMKKIPATICSWREMSEMHEYLPLDEKDNLYTAEEALKLMNKYVEKTQTAMDVLTSLERGVCQKYPAVSKRTNCQTELKHLYNALDNTLCTLHYSKINGRTKSQAYKDYTKALHNLRKRFYFYYDTAGQHTVDYLETMIDGKTKSLKDKKINVAFKLNCYKRLLAVLEDYIRRVSEIKCAQK